MNLNELAKSINDIAINHGFWEDDRGFGEVIALIHSEASEALEEYRHGHEFDEVYYGVNSKPEGIPIELADIIIRVLDFCGMAKIDIHTAVHEKIEYNRTRPYKHGGMKA